MLLRIIIWGVAVLSFLKHQKQRFLDKMRKHDGQTNQTHAKDKDDDMPPDTIYPLW
jgi:hypothetical protein